MLESSSTVNGRCIRIIEQSVTLSTLFPSYISFSESSVGLIVVHFQTVFLIRSEMQHYIPACFPVSRSLSTPSLIIYHPPLLFTRCISSMTRIGLYISHQRSVQQPRERTRKGGAEERRKDGWSESSKVYRSDDGCPHLSEATAIMFTGNQFDLLLIIVVHKHFCLTV